MSKSFVWGFIVGVALLIVVGVGASRLQDKMTKLKDREEKLFQMEIKDATPVQLGVLTEEQRIHSKLYAYYKPRADSMPGYGKISDFFINPIGKVMEKVAGVGLGPKLEPETPENFFGELARESDAIIRGRVTSKVSQVTEDDAFIFTDYDIVVTDIFRDNLAAPLELEKTIIVTRPGGKVVVNEIVGKATDQYFLPLSLNHDVILFLKFIPETGAYQATRYTGSFELDGASVRPLTEAKLPLGVLQDGQSFLKIVRAVSNK